MHYFASINPYPEHSIIHIFVDVIINKSEFENYLSKKRNVLKKIEHNSTDISR